MEKNNKDNKENNKTHNIKPIQNTQKKSKNKKNNKKQKTEEELQKEETIKINNAIELMEDTSNDIKKKLFYINILRAETEKLSNINLPKESLKIKEKYEPKYCEFYNLISDVVSTSDSSKLKNLINEDDKQKYKIENDETSDICEPIQDFWYTVIERGNYFTLKDNDEKILKHLINVKCFMEKNQENNNDYSYSFKIVFYFEENEYFINEEISKIYYYDKVNPEKLYKVEFPTINWKENKLPKKDSFFDMFYENKCSLEESESEVNYIRNDFFPNILELFMNFQDDSEDEQYDNYI